MNTKNDKLLFNNRELLIEKSNQDKLAAKLTQANKELFFQNEEKEKRAAELILANIELAFQNEEKEKRAAELLIANLELVFENNEKEKRAAELILANIELAFQNEEKEKRAAELLIANQQLLFENKEKEKRASELIIANKELTFQNEEKIKRAEELIMANRKLIVANNELIAFTYISSHDLQEPLRKIQTFISILLENEKQNLTDQGKIHFQRIQSSASRMRRLISDLLDFSRINNAERKFESIDLHLIIEEVEEELLDTIKEKKAVIKITKDIRIPVIVFQFRQLFYNLLENALKFSKPDIPTLILIESKIVTSLQIETDKILPDRKYCHILVKDNGIGFEQEFEERIFEVFQKLHSKEEYSGTGIGLAIVKKIVENHNGIITATSELGKGTSFNIYIPLYD